MLVVLHLWNIVAAALLIAFLHSRLEYLWDKQNSGVLTLFFLAGVFSTVLFWIFDALYIFRYFVPFFYANDFTYHIFITGVVEEGTKFFCFILVAHSVKSIKEPQDGVILGAMVGLAFGVVENWIYFSNYREWGMLLRPILATPGHAIYGGIWGGMYSAAVYSNYFSQDRSSYRLAWLGFFISAVVHGVYNGILQWGIVAGIAVDIVALSMAIYIFLRLIDSSPYRKFPLSQAGEAVKNIQRGLFFNPKSSLLNRNMGLYLMYLGKYRRAAEHLAKSMPRANDSRRARFFAAVCELPIVPEYHARRRLRIAWSRLSDGQRVKLLKQLDLFLKHDPQLLKQVHDFIDSAFQSRDWMPPHKLARELRRRKAERRSGIYRSPVFEEIADKMNPEERRRLAKRLQSYRGD